MENMIIWSPGATLEQTERQHIEKTLAYHKGNKTATAHALGIAIRTLDSKLEKYEADEELQEKLNEERKARDADFLARSRGNPGGQHERLEDVAKRVPKPQNGLNPTAITRNEEYSPESPHDIDEGGFEEPAPKKTWSRKKRA